MDESARRIPIRLTSGTDGKPEITHRNSPSDQGAVKTRPLKPKDYLAMVFTVTPDVHSTSMISMSNEEL